MIEKSAMTKHAWENHHPINWEETSVLDKGQGELLLKEALHISCLILHLVFLWSRLRELQDHSPISHMSVLMHIQINIITPLYLVPFVTGILFASLVRLSVSSIKSSFWAYMQISLCCYIECPLHLLHKSFMEKEGGGGSPFRLWNFMFVISLAIAIYACLRNIINSGSD